MLKIANSIDPLDGLQRWMAPSYWPGTAGLIKAMVNESATGPIGAAAAPTFPRWKSPACPVLGSGQRGPSIRARGCRQRSPDPFPPIPAPVGAEGFLTDPAHGLSTPPPSTHDRDGTEILCGCGGGRGLVGGRKKAPCLPWGRWGPGQPRCTLLSEPKYDGSSSPSQGRMQCRSGQRSIQDGAPNAAVIGHPFSPLGILLKEALCLRINGWEM